MNYLELMAMTVRPANCGIFATVQAVLNTSAPEWTVGLVEAEGSRLSSRVRITGDQTEQQVAWELRGTAHRLADNIREAANAKAYRIESAWTAEVLEPTVSRYCVYCGSPRKVTKSTTAFQCATPECRATVVVR
jgi:hypothetical protein